MTWAKALAGTRFVLDDLQPPSRLRSRAQQRLHRERASCLLFGSLLDAQYSVVRRRDRFEVSVVVVVVVYRSICSLQCWFSVCFGIVDPRRDLSLGRIKDLGWSVLERRIKLDYLPEFYGKRVETRKEREDWQWRNENCVLQKAITRREQLESLCK